MTQALDLDGVRGWFAAVLAQHGAILEPQDGGALFACLPPALQQRLALPNRNCPEFPKRPAPVPEAFVAGPDGR